MKEEILKIINSETCWVIFISAMSWIANYLYKQGKWEIWHWKMFFINTCLSIYVGYWLNLILPESSYKLFLILISTFLSRDILWILEIYLPKIIEKKIEQNYLDNENIWTKTQ